MEKTDLKSLPMDQLEQWVLEHGEKKFRAKQLYQWMHVKLADSVEQMSNLPAKLREQISENSTFTQYGRERADALQTRQFRVYFLSGWVPYGLPFLCVNLRWTGA